jgi:dihydrodipicolinate synthase/N-acetylneuraminate lyase
MSTTDRLLSGPCFPVVTPFVDDATARHPIDFDAMERYVDRLIEGGGRIIMAASATGRFAQLRDEEIEAVNESILRACGDRALAVASTPILGTTADHVEIARRAERAGARVVICEYPWRYQRDDALIAYFQAIADATDAIDIMLHVTPSRSELGGQYRYDVDALRRICDIPRVVGMKEAAGDREHSHRIWEALADRTAIIVAGRASETYLEAFDHGAAGFFVGTGNIVPEHSVRVHELLVAGKRDDARQVVARHETPFLDAAKRHGWHAALKAALAERGWMSDVERPPMVPVRPEERVELVRIMSDCGWLD